MQKLQKQHNCIPDEHYVQTLLTVRFFNFCCCFVSFFPFVIFYLFIIIDHSVAMAFYELVITSSRVSDWDPCFYLFYEFLCQMSEREDELERRTLTYTLWNNSATKTESKGWHPMTFTHANAAPQKIKEIKVLLNFLIFSWLVFLPVSLF